MSRLATLGVAALLALAVIVHFDSTASAKRRPPAPPCSGGSCVPASVVGDCSTDVTQPILAWVASVPDGSMLSFGSGACYRIEGTLELSNRRGLDFQGNGSSFRSLSSPADQRALWRLIDSTSIVLRNMTLDGSYAQGGTLDPSLQHAHAVDLRGTSAELAGLTMTDLAGDCVYFGRGFTSALTRSSGSLHDSSCSRIGRNAVSVTAGDNILVQRLRTDTIGYDVFDVEPNLGVGWGSNSVQFDSNTVGSYALNVYSLVENGPIANQSFTNNRVLGHGLKIAIGDPSGAGYRPQNVTISGNYSDTAQTPSAVNADNVDGLAVTGNTIPMSGGAMATVSGSCNVTVSGNSYPGGFSEALIFPAACA